MAKPKGKADKATEEKVKAYFAKIKNDTKPDGKKS